MATADDVDVHLSSTEAVELFKKYVIGNYNRYPVNLVRGEGSFVWDAEGRGTPRVSSSSVTGVGFRSRSF